MGVQNKWMGYLKDKSSQVVETAEDVSYQVLKNFSFTSIGGGTGSTMTILYVSQYLASQGKKVCVVDLNFLKPDVLYHYDVDVTQDNTLLNYFKGSKDLKKCFIQDANIPDLYLLTMSPKDPVEGMVSLDTDINIVENLLDKLQFFDYVLVNLPYEPVQAVFLETLMKVDRGYLVVDERMEAVARVGHFLRYVHEMSGKANNFNNVILNKRTGIGYPFENLQQDADVIAEVGYDSRLVEYMNERKPLINKTVSEKFTEGIGKVIDDLNDGNA